MSNDTMTDALPTSGYTATPSLPDAEGNALLGELWKLEDAISREPETNKKIRKGSYEQRAAIAKLQAAMLKTAARFERHKDFIDWLENNYADSIAGYDPTPDLSNMRNDIYNLKQDIKWLRERCNSDGDIYQKVVLQLLSHHMALKKAGLLLEELTGQQAITEAQSNIAEGGKQ